MVAATVHFLYEVIAILAALFGFFGVVWIGLGSMTSTFSTWMKGNPGWAVNEVYQIFTLRVYALLTYFVFFGMTFSAAVVGMAQYQEFFYSPVLLVESIGFFGVLVYHDGIPLFNLCARMMGPDSYLRWLTSNKPVSFRSFVNIMCVSQVFDATMWLIVNSTAVDKTTLYQHGTLTADQSAMLLELDSNIYRIQWIRVIGYMLVIAMYILGGKCEENVKNTQHNAGFVTFLITSFLVGVLGWFMFWMAYTIQSGVGAVDPLSNKQRTYLSSAVAVVIYGVFVVLSQDFVTLTICKEHETPAVGYQYNPNNWRTIVPVAQIDSDQSGGKDVLVASKGAGKSRMGGRVVPQ
jgi:hypothetical protein